MPSITTIQAVKNSLSLPRIGTYEAALDSAGNPITSRQALHLYAWNAQVSAALMAPLHICEVVVRNAVSDALEAVYGQNWPRSVGFEPLTLVIASLRTSGQRAERTTPRAR